MEVPSGAQGQNMETLGNSNEAVTKNDLVSGGGDMHPCPLPLATPLDYKFTQCPMSAKD